MPGAIGSQYGAPAELFGERSNNSDASPVLNKSEEFTWEVEPGVPYKIKPDGVVRVLPLFARSGALVSRAQPLILRGGTEQDRHISVSELRIVPVFGGDPVEVAVINPDYPWDEREWWMSMKGSVVLVSEIQENCVPVKE